MSELDRGLAVLQAIFRCSSDAENAEKVAIAISSGQMTQEEYELAMKVLRQDGIIPPPLQTIEDDESKDESIEDDESSACDVYDVLGRLATIDIKTSKQKLAVILGVLGKTFTLYSTDVVGHEIEKVSEISTLIWEKREDGEIMDIVVHILEAEE